MLTMAAHRIGNDERARGTPFELEAAKANIIYRGGKPDDVTVVCALLVPDTRRDEEEEA